MSNWRTVKIWIGNDYLEAEYEQPEGMSEDEFCEEVALDVYNTISIEVE